MEKEIINVIIENLEYDRDNNLFQMKIIDTENKRKAVLAIKGTDWGITPDVPMEIIKDFCKEMTGQQKTLHIEKDQSSFSHRKKEGQKIESEEAEKINENIDNYPIKEVFNFLQNKKDHES